MAVRIIQCSLATKNRCQARLLSSGLHLCHAPQWERTRPWTSHADMRHTLAPPLHALTWRCFLSRPRPPLPCSPATSLTTTSIVAIFLSGRSSPSLSTFPSPRAPSLSAAFQVRFRQLWAAGESSDRVHPAADCVRGRRPLGQQGRQDPNLLGPARPDLPDILAVQQAALAHRVHARPSSRAQGGGTSPGQLTASPCGVPSVLFLSLAVSFHLSPPSIITLCSLGQVSIIEGEHPVLLDPVSYPPPCPHPLRRLS